MHIEYLQTKNPQFQRNSSGRGMPSASDVEQHLVQLQGTMHDGQAAALFAAASTWAYSDLNAFAVNMGHCGLYGEFVSITLENPAAFVDKTAYLFLSENKNLAILTYQGAQPDSVIPWLANANAQMQKGGMNVEFLAATMVIAPLLKDLLLGWSESSTSLAEGLEWVRENRGYPDDVFPTDDQLFPASDSDEQPKSKKKTAKKTSQKSGAAEGADRSESERDRALYITGHGLGGTFAAMCGAMLYLDRSLEPLQTKLRSVYTFGAPMFAPKSLADMLDMQFGNRVFRHRFGRDIVPMLSACPQGWSKHFGYGFRCSLMASGWVPTGRFMDDVYAPMIANLFGMMALVKERVTMRQWVGSFPIVWADHLPLRYLRTSLAMQSGTQMGQEFGADFPDRRK